MKIKELKKLIRGSQEDFKKLGRREEVPYKRVRLLALQMFKEGKTMAAIGEALGVAYRTVKEWLLRFIRNGINGLDNAPGRGRKSFFPKDQKDVLIAGIEKLQQEKNGGRITGHDIQLFINTTWNLNYGLAGIYDLLSRYGIVWITGRSKHPKSNIHAQEEFKKN